MDNKDISDIQAPIGRPPTLRETALYTHDMLVSLRKMALGQRQKKLADLIETAADEARAVAVIAGGKVKG